MPQGEKRKLFAQHQEATRKDVERAFGVLQSRFAIIRGPVSNWHHITGLIQVSHHTFKEERKFKMGELIFNYNMILLSIFGNILGKIMSKISCFLKLCNIILNYF
jgi:hypothetical protein